MTGNVYYLRYFDSEGDDRRGSSADAADEYGVWLSEAAAQAKADELNAPDIARYEARRKGDFQRQYAQWERACLEHDTLYDAGLRPEPYDKPKPVFIARLRGGPQSLCDAEGYLLLRDYYEVASFELNEETP